MAKPRFLHKFNVCEHPMITSAPPMSAELLAHWVPLAALKPESRAELARKAFWIERSAGELLVEEGQNEQNALFLQSGRLRLTAVTDDDSLELTAGQDAARHRVRVDSAGGANALCLTHVRCLALDRQLIDMMLTWEQSTAAEQEEQERERAIAAAEDDDWMMRLLQTPAFQMIPPANLQAMFLRMETVDARPGQAIVQQDTEGDYFYVITEGRCIVTRQQPPHRPIQLAQLEVGSCFGEEALISDSPRNASVTMLTHGKLKRLAKQDFRKLLNEPLTRRVTWTEAEGLVESGRARYLDVRLPSEFLNRKLPGSINIPLYLLRMRLRQVDPAKQWICVCDTGRRSSVASFLLMQRGYDAYILDRGLPSN